MVSKSYEVNPNKRITTSEKIHNNELVKCEKNEKMQNNNENQKKMFDRYILQISNEMVRNHYNLLH
jgi:RecA/RadA recombinase